jgi:hypothetical protein
MKKIVLSISFFWGALAAFGQNASDLFISEYAEGSSNNKYIEIFNGTGDSVDLSNYALWRISNGGTWPEDSNIMSGWLYDGEVLVAANSSADTAILNLPNATIAYNTSTFYNGNDAVGLAKWTGSAWVLIDAVGKQGTAPSTAWDVAGTTNATAEHTLIRKFNVCEPDTNWDSIAGTSVANSQWIVMAQNFWDSAGTHYMNCSAPPPPPVSLVPIYPIGTIETVDTNGVPDSNGVNCGIRGIVVGVDLQGTSSSNSFTVIDNSGGIGVFKSGGFTPPYTVTEGDSVIVFGTIGHFNGLAQINGDSMMVLNSGNSLPTPALVTTLDESTESEYIMMENLEIIAIASSNYTLQNAVGTVVMRIDSDTDVDDSLSFAVGDSICSLIGIGGQYDNSSPYSSGYQIFPHHYYDVEFCVEDSTGPEPEVPFYPIAVINNDDATGYPDSIGVYCWTKGVVLGVDLDGNNGISFTLWDEEGINIFNFVDVSNYVVTQGDSIMARGSIDFYNGLTELFTDSIILLNSGNPLPMPAMVQAPGQATESEPIRINNVSVIDTTQWPSGGSSNVQLLTCSGDTIIMRIDSDTDVDENWPSAPTGTFNVTGIGGQFDNSSPYLDNYQIFPMFSTDLDTSSMPAPSIVINELMSNNTSSVSDEFGDFDGWIELYNTGSNDIPLGGLFLTNDVNDPLMYQIPFTSSEMVSAGGYKLIWADNEDGEGDLHTNFTLDQSGGFVAVAYMSGCDVMAADSITYVALDSNQSYGRQTDGGTPWVVFSIATPNAMNEFLAVEELHTNGLKAFPNPNTTGVLFFNKSVSFTLYNLTGQIVLSGRNMNQVDLSELTEGLYLIETTDGESVRVIVK